MGLNASASIMTCYIAWCRIMHSINYVALTTRAYYLVELSEGHVYKVLNVFFT